jgi:PhnB protein
METDLIFKNNPAPNSIHMKNPKIPANYQTVMPYLILEKASEFLVFAKQVFDAAETSRVMKDQSTIMHSELMIGECTLMLADATDKYSVKTAMLFIYVDNADIKYSKAIDAGATAIREVSDQPYGRSGGVKDPWGNEWWITSLI